MNSINDKIAVVGIACRFPGARNMDEFWANLVEGKECIKTFTDEELSKYEVNYSNLKTNPNYVKARGVLEDVDKFDAGFFGYTPNEAALTDPQHRIWLEIAWDAFENAGLDPYSYPGAIGVYAGSFINMYMINNILRDQEKLENYIRLRSTSSFQLMTSNDGAFIPTKTAYKFNLKGPAINVQTACSTSLVAIVQACQSLLSYESDVCLAGGVCILTPQETGYIYQEGAIPSPDGHCRPFDKDAKGTVFSNGVGIVILKRLEDALNEGDRIYSVVSGWALNNDGNKKVSFTAPAKDGQAEAILMAQRFAEVKPEDIGYVETHGTGTKLGDPIEISALTKVFTNGVHKKQYCGIGSIKSNIGHTDAAAGVASFIKASLSVYHRKIPPTINFNEPNPYIDFANSPFYVVNKLKEWNDSKPLIIGVSSFGIGGTNSHVIIEEPPKISKKETSGSLWPQIVVVSAKSETALEQRKRDLISYLEKNSEINLQEMAATLLFRRSHMNYRSFTTVNTLNELTTNCEFTNGRAEDVTASLAFVFPGQGAQYINMGKQLYTKVPLFRKIVQECFSIFQAETNINLEPILFANENTDEAINKLAQTCFTQPSLFIIEYGLAKVLQQLELNPRYLIGHSIGEYAAACIAGVFDLPSALKIVIKRGQLMQQMPSGTMLAVRCSKQELENLNCSLFEIAAENSSSACTISLKHENLEEVKKILLANNISCVALNTSHAFHSSAFDPILMEFATYVNSFNLKEPKIPFISCLTGKFIKECEAISGEYWANQLRHTVLFAEGLNTLLENENIFFLEVGPNMHLSSFIKSNKLVKNKNHVMATLGKSDDKHDETIKIINTLGNLWNIGYPVQFKSIYNYQGVQHVSLPSYPFERKRYWIDYFPQQNELQPQSGKVSLELEAMTSNPLKSRDSSVGTNIKQMLSEQSGFAIDDLKPDLTFQNLGFDSMFLAQFARNLEKKYNLNIAFRQLVGELNTIALLSQFLESRLTKNIHLSQTIDSKADNLVVIQSTGSGTPLVMVHGDNANNFFPQYFVGERPIYSFLHLGADGYRNPYKSTEKIATAYVDRLLKMQPEGPFNICGFSFGGVLAFEMANNLQKRGKKVEKLIIIDAHNPHVENPTKGFSQKFRVKILRPLRFNLRSLKYMSFYLLKIPVPVKKRSSAIVHNYKILGRSYKPSKFTGSILLFKTVDNPSTYKYLGWEGLADHIQLAALKGKHTEIMKMDENIEPLIQNIKSYLNK